MTNQAPAKQKDPVETVEFLLQKYKKDFEMSLPKHLTTDRFLRLALSEFRKTPALKKCDPRSFLSSLMQSSALGLEPGGSLGHCYLIPYGSNCQFILGYRGMIELARRSAQIVSIQAHEVYENDEFIFEYGLEEKLIHRPCLGERGKVKLFYALSKLVGGGYQIDMMTIADIDRIRSRSKSNGTGPWETDYNEMAKKTVVRRLFKYLPISIEYQKAAVSDEIDDLIKTDSEKEVSKDLFSDLLNLPEPIKEYTNSTDSLMSKITPQKTDDEMFREAELAHLTVEGQVDGLMDKLRAD